MIRGRARPAVGGNRFASRRVLLSRRTGHAPASALDVRRVAAGVRALAGFAPPRRGCPRGAPLFGGQVPVCAGGTDWLSRVVFGCRCFRPTGFYL